VVAQYVNIHCQDLNWISAQTTGVVHLAPNFMNHLVMLFKHDLHRKRNIFRTFALSTTSKKASVSGTTNLKVIHALHLSLTGIHRKDISI
jgi:hypothetical protein